MLIGLLKVVISAVVIGLVTVISQKYPGVGGWIAALPLVSLLSATWLILGHQPRPDVVNFLTGVLKGLIPTAALLLMVVIGLHKGWSFVGAFSVAVVCWGASSLILSKISF